MATATGEIGQVARTETVDLAGAAIGTASGGGANSTLYNTTPNTGISKAIPASGNPNTEAPVAFVTASGFMIQVDAGAAARVAISIDGATFGDNTELLLAGSYSFPIQCQKVKVDGVVAGPGGNYVITFLA